MGFRLLFFHIIDLAILNLCFSTYEKLPVKLFPARACINKNLRTRTIFFFYLAFSCVILHSVIALPLLYRVCELFSKVCGDMFWKAQLIRDSVIVSRFALTMV